MTKKDAVIQCYEQLSGHVSGIIALAAIAVSAQELTGSKVSLEEALEIIEQYESAKK